MILLDTNILIYSAQSEYKYLRELYIQTKASVSIISKLEVLGYHKITSEQTNFFNAVFKLLKVMPITEHIIDQAIDYRKKKAMTVADALIASTAMLYGYDLYTNNIEDFKNIKDFKIINPLIKKT